MGYKDAEKRREYQRLYWRKYQNAERKGKAVRARRARTHVWLAEYKATQKCELCPESHPACLDFHHKDPATKSGTLTELIADHGYSVKRLLEEIARCMVLCANCHRKLHWDEKHVA